MSIIGLIIALALFCHFKRRLRHYRRACQLDEERMSNLGTPCARSWHEEWQRNWAEKFRREADRHQRDWERYASRHAWRSEREARRRARAGRSGVGSREWPGGRWSWGPWRTEASGSNPGAAAATILEAATAVAGAALGAAAGVTTSSAASARSCECPPCGPAAAQSAGARAAGSPGSDASAGERDPRAREDHILRRARRRAAAETSFYAHLMSYLGVIAFLAFVNLLTTRYPWFLWPALGWGIGLFAHWMAVFGSRILRQRYFDPAVEREVRRETVAVRTEKQASIDELSATIAHEIRNPIAAAKSLVQQMGEDPRSVENVEYAQVALDELDRVERSISHLLRYAKEEDLHFAPVGLAAVIDAALTELKAKLDAARVSVSRNYIGGPTIIADGEKLRQVFANILDNAIDALEPVVEGRRIELFIDNGTPSRARVRVRDNGAGIPPERIDRIFNPFFTTKDKGTGLGMAISKKIVEAHEGTIDVVSEPGRGAEFVVTLPLPH